MALATPALDVQIEVLPVPLARVRAREAEVLRRLDAYERGRNDREAAEILGLEKDAFQAWRLRAGLPARGERTRVRTKWHDPAPSAELDAIRREVLASARSDAEAARVLGVSRPVFREWRSRHGIPPKRPRGFRVAVEVRVEARHERAPKRAREVLPSEPAVLTGPRSRLFCRVDGTLLRGGVCPGCEAARDRTERAARDARRRAEVEARLARLGESSGEGPS